MFYRMLIILCFHLAFANLTVAHAASSKTKQKAVKVVKKTSISKGSAIKIAKSEVKGKVLSAKLIKSKGPAVYRIKMLVGDSRVRTVFVDGYTGKVIRIN